MLEYQNKLSILKRVEFIYLELKDLEQYKNLTFEEYDTNRFIRRNVERIIENIANAIIDISKIIIANSDVQVPDSLSVTGTRLIKCRLVSSQIRALTS